MRFLTDQDVYRGTVEKLRAWGHDVITAKEMGLQRAPDEELLKAAGRTTRLLVTRDKDFGALVFLKKSYPAGVVFLRMSPSTAEDVHKELLQLLGEHDEAQLQHCFSVVERNRYRLRRIHS